MLHPLILKSRVHAETCHAFLKAHFLYFPERHFGKPPASEILMKSHAVGYHIGPVRQPRAFYIIIGRLSTEVHAHICGDRSIYFQYIATFLFYVLPDGIQRGIIVGPLHEPLLSLE